MLYLDLSELDQVFAGRWLWSVDRRNVAQFRRSDYLGDRSLPLDEAVRQRVEQHTGRRPDGPIRLLTHLRTFGHCFNPVSFYYCFGADGCTLETIVAEITNTPWKERHSYVLPVATATRRRDVLAFAFDKQFHVSPFLPLDRRYDWRFTAPAETLRVHMNVIADSGTEFDATLALQRRPIDAAGLARTLLGYPLMTARIVLAIHWHALLLWCKRNPVYDHPSKRDRHNVHD